ncbi:MAG: hypothetical protein M0P61_08565 [Ignavibacteriaceae bacterium]|nr:hypothetical protein [Ignavibacteriaceae bacterium]
MQTIKFYLVPSLKAMLNGKAGQLEINLVIKFAHQFAVTRLAQLVKNRKVYLDIYPHNLNTIALDCIAELFERDEKNNFVELIHFYEGKRIKDLSDEEIISYFRNLIFSKIHDSIYRIYNERDPVLGKILRNVKLIVKKEETINKFQRFGITFLSLCNEDERNYQFPEYPIEELQSEVTLLLKGNENIKKIFLSTMQVINNTISYRKFFSLLDIAIVIKRILFNLRINVDEFFRLDDALIETDLEKIVRNALIEVRSTLKDKYGEKEKTTTKYLESYISAVEELMTNIFIRNDGLEMSNFDCLANQIPNLEYEEYRRTHRNQFEYMVRVSKDIVIDKLKVLMN